MREAVTRELNIRWKRATRQMITAEGTLSDLTKVAESMPINVYGSVIPVLIVLAKFRSEQVIVGPPGKHTLECV